MTGYMTLHYQYYYDTIPLLVCYINKAVVLAYQEYIYNSFSDTMIGYYEDTDIRTIRLPPTDFIESLQADISRWESVRFGTSS